MLGLRAGMGVRAGAVKRGVSARPWHACSATRATNTEARTLSSSSSSSSSSASSAAQGAPTPSAPASATPPPVRKLPRTGSVEGPAHRRPLGTDLGGGSLSRDASQPSPPPPPSVLDPPSAALEGLRRTSLVVRLRNTPGALEKVLRVLREQNLTRIESRPTPSSETYDVFLDLDVDPERPPPLEELERVCASVQALGPRPVPWFPRKREDLDAFANKTLDAGAELAADHPGFQDAAYRARREAVVANARRYRHGDELPLVEYSDAETRTWGTVYDELRRRYPSMACGEYLGLLAELEAEGVYTRKAVPQLRDIQPWLQRKTGFALRPVSGLLSARDFLNGLALRVFSCTQYIRHPSRPLYTPEPDVVHELMGHVPMLGDPAFARLSQEIGLASLGASDADIRRLATLYWFSVEYGLVRAGAAAQGGGGSPGSDVRAYGAGLLSSFGELEHACKDRKPEVRPFDPLVACDQPYPITTFQPVLFVADSLEDAALRIRDFCEESIRRVLHARYDADADRVVVVDRAVVRQKPPPAGSPPASS